MAYQYRFFRDGEILDMSKIEDLGALLECCIEISRSTFLEHVPHGLFRSCKHGFDSFSHLLCTDDYEIKFYGVELGEVEGEDVIVFMTYVNEQTLCNTW